jgi:hypothetical protein
VSFVFDVAGNRVRSPRVSEGHVLSPFLKSQTDLARIRPFLTAGLLALLAQGSFWDEQLTTNN